MSCSLLSNDNTKLEWILLTVASVLFVMTCIVFASGATLLLMGFSVAVTCSVFGLMYHRWPHIKLHRVVAALTSSVASLLFFVQLILLIIAFPRILPYIYDRRLAPGPFILGAIFSSIVVLFGFGSTTLMAIKYYKNIRTQVLSNQPSRFVMLPVEFTPVRYT